MYIFEVDPDVREGVLERSAEASGIQTTLFTFLSSLSLVFLCDVPRAMEFYCQRSAGGPFPKARSLIKIVQKGRQTYEYHSILDHDDACKRGWA